MADCKLKLREIAVELKISKGSVFTILHEHLSMRKVCSKWVPHLLTVDQKQHVNNSQCCLQLFQQIKKEFLHKTFDNGWNMNLPLHSGLKSAVSWVDSSRGKPSKATKDTNISKGCPRGVMVKAMDCGIIVCEFILQSRYYVRANTLGKGMNPLILPAMG